MKRAFLLLLVIIALSQTAQSTTLKEMYDKAQPAYGYDKYIELNPNDADAYFNRGLAYELKGDKEKAIADFRKALEIAPSFQEAKAALERLGVTP